MIRVKAQANRQFDNKLDALDELADQTGVAAAGFPEEEVSEENIVKARAINNRYKGQDIPPNWYPRYPVPHAGSGATDAMSYRGWAFMEHAAEEFDGRRKDEMLRQWFSALMMGRRTQDIKERMGETLVKLIKKHIKQVNHPQLATATVERKGDDTLLFETGAMFNSVTYVERDE